MSVDEAINDTVEEAVSEAVEENNSEPDVEVDVEPTTIIVESDAGESPVTEVADGLELAERIRQIAREEAGEIETRIMSAIPSMVEAYAPAPVVIESAPEPEHEEADEEPRREHWFHRKLWG